METLPHFQSYFWKNGKPVGKQIGSSLDPMSFKVITDPYHKRYSIEKYEFGAFIEVIYDSNLLDFRRLKTEDTEAWQKETIEETNEVTRSLIRNMDERLILIEEAFFKDNICTCCKFLSPQGIWIASQKIYHQSNGDAFNGVILSDCLGNPILIKRYAEEENIFTTLLSEEWMPALI